MWIIENMKFTVVERSRNDTSMSCRVLNAKLRFVGFDLQSKALRSP